MIVVECLYTSNEIEEETILREQQKRCLAAAASYGWAVRREVFEPLQLSARGMDDRTGIQTILDDVCNRRFDLLRELWEKGVCIRNLGRALASGAFLYDARNIRKRGTEHETHGETQ